MGRSFLKYALAVAVSLAPGTTAPPTSKSELAGWYVCEGSNPDGTAYQGVVEIVQLQETFLVRWMTGDDTTAVGVGVFRDGVFSVSYYGDAPAIAVYKADEDSLVGEWTIGAEGAVHFEMLTKTTREPPRPPRNRTPIRGLLAL